MFTKVDKALIAALIGIVFWFVNGVQSGDWSNTEALEALLVTVGVYMIPNKQ